MTPGDSHRPVLMDRSGGRRSFWRVCAGRGMIFRPGLAQGVTCYGVTCYGLGQGVTCCSLACYGLAC